MSVIKSSFVVERRDGADSSVVRQKELEARMHAQLRKAFERGKEDGFKEGVAAGKQEGIRQGLEEGQRQGYEKGVSEGLEKGREEGLQQGRAEIQQELADKFSLIEKILEQAQAKEARFMVDGEQELLKLSLLVAEKIVREKLRQAPSLRQFVQQVVALVVDKSSIVVRLNETDAESLRDIKNMLALQGGEINVVVDSRLSRGDCVVETNSGNFDARISSQLAEIKKHLLVEDA